MFQTRPPKSFSDNIAPPHESRDTAHRVFRDAIRRPHHTSRRTGMFDPGIMAPVLEHAPPNQQQISYISKHLRRQPLNPPFPTPSNKLPDHNPKINKYNINHGLLLFNASRTLRSRLVRRREIASSIARHESAS